MNLSPSTVKRLYDSLIDTVAMLEAHTDPKRRTDPSTFGQSLSTLRTARLAIQTAKLENHDFSGREPMK